MKQVRDAALDRMCEETGEDLDAINEATKRKESTRQKALKRMQEKGRIVYVHAGVEFARKPGGETLSVRRTKKGGEEADDTSFEAAAEDPELDAMAGGDEDGEPDDELSDLEEGNDNPAAE